MMQTTYAQPSAKPTRKVQGAGIGAGIATLLAAAMQASGHPVLVAFLAYPGVEAAAGGLIATGVAYFVRERA